MSTDFAIDYSRTKMQQKIQHTRTFSSKTHLYIYINYLSKCELQRRLIAAWSRLVCTSMSWTRQWTMWRGRWPWMTLNPQN